MAAPTQLRDAVGEIAQSVGVPVRVTDVTASVEGGCESPGTVSGVAGSDQFSFCSVSSYSHAVVLISDYVVDECRRDEPCLASALASAEPRWRVMGRR